MMLKEKLKKTSHDLTSQLVTTTSMLDNVKNELEKIKLNQAEQMSRLKINHTEEIS